MVVIIGHTFHRHTPSRKSCISQTKHNAGCRKTWQCGVQEDMVLRTNTDYVMSRHFPAVSWQMTGDIPRYMRYRYINCALGNLIVLKKGSILYYFTLQL